MANRREVETHLALHRAMQRDAKRLAQRLASAEPAEVVGDLAKWFDVYRTALTQHHEVEDELLFPFLVESNPGFSSVLDELSAQHEDLERTLTGLGEAVHGGDMGAARDRAGQLVQLLDQHLATEEAGSLDLLNAMTDEEFKAIDRGAAKLHSLGESLGVIGWMVESFDDAERANLWSWQPFIVRVIAAAVRPAQRRREAAANLPE